MFKDHAKTQDIKIEMMQSEMKTIVDSLKHEQTVLKLKHDSFVQETEKKHKTSSSISSKNEPQEDSINKKHKNSFSPLSKIMQSNKTFTNNEDIILPKHVLMQLLSENNKSSKNNVQCDGASINNAFNNTNNNNNNRSSDQYTFPFFGNTNNNKDIPTLMLYSQMLNSLK